MTSKKVYLTPSVIFAFIDRAHEKHDQADAYFRFFASEEYQLYIDIVTIEETYKRLSERITPSIGRDFLRTIFISDINIIHPEESETKAALKALVNYNSLDITFSEALASVLANKRGITQMCTLEYLHSLFGVNVFYLPI